MVEADVVPWRYPPRFDSQYGDWLRSEFESGNPEPWPTTTSRDLATLVTMVLRYGEPLVGAPPGEVLEPVPRADLEAAMVGDLELLLDDLRPDTRNVVLTLARVWSTLATGEIRSKTDAADWALVRLPEEHRRVLAHARAAYVGREEERWDALAERVVPHAEHVVAEIRRLSA